MPPSSTVNLRYWGWVIPLLLVVLHAWWDTVVPDQLVRSVDNFASWPFFESQRTYAYLHLFSFLPVFLLSFDQKVHYYKKWKYLLPGMTVIAAVFVLWDVWFTNVGVWGFNENYYLDFLIWHLPVEEWLFFITIPFCCVFIYECVGAYLNYSFWVKNQRKITIGLILLFTAGLFARWGHLYTVTTFGLMIGLLFVLLMRGTDKIGGQFYVTYIISCIPFFLVNGVLTGMLTTEPVVMYNPDEFFGIRLGTIPLDDMVYSMLLLLSNITCYEVVKARWEKSNLKSGAESKKILYYKSFESHHEHMSNEAR